MAEKEGTEHWIWELVEKGLTVFPLGTVGEEPPGWIVKRADGDKEFARAMWPKQPRIKWAEYQTKKPSDEQIEAWLRQWPDCNFAIATGKEIDVVDADDQEAVDWVKANLTRTPWVVYTGKGAHFYYQCNTKVVLKNSANTQGRLDTRGRGGYVVAPGSMHANGSRYALEVDPDFPVDSIADLPCLSNDDLRKIHAYKRAPESIGGPAGNLVGFDANKYTAIEAGVREGGRNQNLTRLVGTWIHEGHSLDQILVKAAQSNAGNQPPLPEHEVLQIIQSVTATHARNHAEELATKAVIEPPKSEGLLLKPGELTASAPRWLVRDVLPSDGIGCLFGPSGGGKSFAVLDLMLHVAAGKDWHGRKTRRQGSVLYVCGEGLQGIANRLRAWEKHTGASLDALPARITRQPVMFMDAASVNALMEAIKADDDLGDVDFLVIDTLNRNFGDGDENTTKDMTRFINALTEIQKTLGCTILVVHHTGLANDERARGSSALRAALDFEIQQKVIEEEGGTPSFQLVGKKMKDGNQVPDAHFELKFIPLGTDEDGEQFGSCVIQPLPEDKVAAAQIAQNLVGNIGKKQAMSVLRLKEYRADCLANKPDLKVVTMENPHLLALLKEVGYAPNDTMRPKKALLKKGLLKELAPGMYEVTQDVDL